MFAWLKKPCSLLGASLGKMRGGPLAILALGLLVGALLVISFTRFLVVTSTESFCAESCHEMGNNAAEYKDTIHDTNRTGVRATCPDCHVPKSPLPLIFRKVGAVHDLWGHFVTHEIDTKEKFEAERYELAKRVWIYMKLSDSRECRSCHTAEKMDPEKQTEKAQARHEKARREKMTCIDCHFAIAHNEPQGGPGPQELKVEREWNWFHLL